MSDDPYKAPSSVQESVLTFRWLTPSVIALLILLSAFVVTWLISGTFFWGVMCFVMYAVARILGWLAGRSTPDSHDSQM